MAISFGNAKSNINTTQRSNELKTPREQVIADLISEIRINGNVTLRGFGTFKVKAMPARNARNPRTGEQVQVPARNKLTFTPAKAMKEII